MKLNQKQLRKIIIEELQKINEESWDTRNKWNDIHHAENLKDDERDEFERGDVAAAEEDKRHEDDLYYDAHDDKEDHHHHRHTGHDEGRKVDESAEALDEEADKKEESRKYPSMMEFLNEYPDTLEEEAELAEDSAPDAAHVDALKADEIEASVAGTSGKLAESDAHMSRGSLYRRRYYGRY